MYILKIFVVPRNRLNEPYKRRVRIRADKHNLRKSTLLKLWLCVYDTNVKKFEK